MCDLWFLKSGKLNVGHTFPSSRVPRHGPRSMVLGAQCKFSLMDTCGFCAGGEGCWASCGARVHSK